MSGQVYDYAYMHSTLNKVINILSIRQFYRESRQQSSLVVKENEQLPKSELNKAALLASVLACSDQEEHQQKAMAFAILAYLDRKNKEFAAYCYIILSRVDNIQQGQHLHEIFNGKKFSIKLDEVLTLELSAKRSLASLQLPGLDTIFTSHFQRKLWDQLESNEKVMAISGPTSAGKSFMVQNHLIQLCKTRDNFRALYIVPTRALIAEVSSDLRNRLTKDNVSIRVAVGDNEECYSREILVLTPERYLQLLRDDKNKNKINFIFMDEVQKVEDSDRGVIFEYVIGELALQQSEANVVLAGPYLKNLKKQ
jgi:hypothetical protein